ncbi:hypothetical protein B0H10DRAFT_1945109 [Mycena sp. CBHHK59/15]|nr:hypothetical protein B0H10DRAFT_1945109 [Mycena sp. CBHHK59/15]
MILALGVQKENFPAKESRITWTQDILKPFPQPVTKVAAPLKSILKNASSPSPFVSMPPVTKTTPKTTDSPLVDPAYLMSPVETLLESTSFDADDISFHDLTEAYNTFSNRIRSQIRAILDAKSLHPALTPLKEHAPQITEALRRDLRRARDDPSSFTRSFAGNSSTTEVDEEEIRVSRDLSLLSHQALRCLSDIFSFPPLYSIFSTNDLRSILSELLALGLAPSIPSPTSRRIWTLTVWILSVQNLPTAVLSPSKDDVVSVLSRAVEGEIDSSAIRLQAVNALGGFALAKISTLSVANTCHQSLSTTLSTFINSETTKRKSVQTQLRLRSLITTALSSEKPSHPADSPFWVVQLLASFVVLVDSPLFTQPRVLKLTLQSLQQIGDHKQKTVLALHPYVWKCLVWAFCRLAVKNEEDDTRDRVFLTVKQDLRSDISAALTLGLIGTAPHDEGDTTSESVSKVLVIVQDLLSTKSQRSQVGGIGLLTRLLYCPQPTASKDREPWDTSSILDPHLFDSSILQPKRDKVASIVRSLRQLGIECARQLSDSEILFHWDVLADLWVRAINLTLDKDFSELRLASPDLSVIDYRQNLLDGWQSLLLMPSDLTQGFQHLTTPDPFAAKIAALISSLLVPAQTVDAQVQRLHVVNKMWRTMTNVFQPGWLASPAEILLAAVLEQTYDLAEEQVRDSWAQLCSELISVGLPSVVATIKVQTENRMSSEVQRQLWGFAIKSIQGSDFPYPWNDLAYLLSIPFRSWMMNDSEVEIWNRLLLAAISSAGSVSVRPAIVIERILEHFDEEHIKKLSDSPKELSALLEYYDLIDRDALPKGVISTVDRAVYRLYPPHQLLPTSLKIIRRLRDIFTSAPQTLALPLLLALNDSLCRWLEDDMSVLEGEAWEDVVGPMLVFNPLSALHGHQPSVETLVALSRFLATIADAYAFERFWRVSYHGRNEFCEYYPEGIKTALRAFGDTFGGSLPAYLSPERYSQRVNFMCLRYFLHSNVYHQESPCVPDSQESPRAGPSNSLDYYADESRYPFDHDTIGMGDDLRETESSAATVRGYRQHRSRPPPMQQTVLERQVRPVPSAALEQLQEYSSRIDEQSWIGGLSSGSVKDAGGSSHSSATIHGASRQNTRQQFDHSAASTPQAPSTFHSSKHLPERNDTPASKRRKTSCDMTYESDRTNAVASSSRHPGETTSEPTSRRHSIIFSDHALSQPVPSRKGKRKRKLVLDYVEVPTFEETRRRIQESSLPTPSPSFRPPPVPRPPSPEEDYGSWEANLSMTEVRQVQNASGSATESPFDDDELADMDVESPGVIDILGSPSLGARVPSRSRTEPIPTREHYPLPLRRNKTSARVDELERACAAVADDASQIPVQDLLHATRLVHEIGTALNEQMGKRNEVGTNILQPLVLDNVVMWVENVQVAMLRLGRKRSSTAALTRSLSPEQTLTQPMPVAATAQPVVDDVDGNEVETIFVTLEALKARLADSVKRKSPLHLKAKTNTTFTDLESLREINANIRIGYDSATEDLIVKYMPSACYEVSSAELVSLVTDQFRLAQNRPFREVGTMCGTATQKLSETRTKQGDQGIFSCARPPGAKPTVVIEVGVSETYTELKEDAHWWLETGQVNLVILIIIANTPPQSVGIELWEPAPPPRGPPHTGAAGRVVSATRRGPRLEYPPTGTAPNLIIRYADIDIPNLDGELVLPMSDWRERVWDYIAL